MSPRPNYNRFRTQGFTLIELLAVIVIMSIIAGLVLYAAIGARKRAQIDAAKAGIAKIAAKIDQYKAKRGVLPMAQPSECTADNLPDCVTTEAYVYKKLDAWGFGLSAKEQIDPWENPYIIVFQTDYRHAFPLDKQLYTDATIPPYTTAPWNLVARLYGIAPPYNGKTISSKAVFRDPANPDTTLFLDQPGSYQIISAGPDGKISCDETNAVDDDNITNFTP